MKTIPLKLIFFPVLSAALFGVGLFQPSRHVIAQTGIASPTSTYDPLSEPPLPSNPTELEFGRNRYWHWCMTCHGDQGQGLTDEFRAVWPEDHQNCWDRGCHMGHVGDEGFPIPKMVPAIVDNTHLSQFASMQGFSDYLKATHPPQSPGVLKDEEYHAIALFVFTMNGRVTDVETPATVPASTPTETPIQPTAPAAHSSPALVIAAAVLIALMVVVFFLLGRAARKVDNVSPSVYRVKSEKEEEPHE